MAEWRVPEAGRAAAMADIWRERALRALATLRTANDNCDRLAAERDEARRHATALRAEVERLHQDLTDADALVAAAVAEERAAVEELTRALDYSNNAREIMRAEKEHGWREAEKWEAKYDALAEERATTGRAVERMKHQNPVNGDGYNYALEKVVALLVKAGGEGVEQAAADERAAIAREQDEVARRFEVINGQRRAALASPGEGE